MSIPERDDNEWKQLLAILAGHARLENAQKELRDQSKELRDELREEVKELRKDLDQRLNQVDQRVDVLEKKVEVGEAKWSGKWAILALLGSCVFGIGGPIIVNLVMKKLGS